MRKLLIVLFFLLLFSTFEVYSQEVEISGFARNYTGVILDENNEYSMLQNTFSLDFSHFSDNTEFRAEPRLTSNMEGDPELELKQLYIDVFFTSFDLRIGKQQIIWGKGDGVFITDLVSPKNLSEFILPDFDEIRTGLTALKTDFYAGSSIFEFVWVPVFTPTAMPDSDSIWNPMPFEIKDENRKDVSKKLENSELFFRYSRLGSALDFEIVTAWMWDDDCSLEYDYGSGDITSSHNRIAAAGGSFSYPLGGVVIRGDGAFYTGKHFTPDFAPANSGKPIEKNYFHYLGGIDYTLFDINLSSQFIQKVILDYEDVIAEDEIKNTVTFLAKKDFLRETLNLELFAYYGLNNSDWLLRPKVLYDLSDSVEIIFGSNLFFGDSGDYGRFDSNDMAYTKVKYSF